MDWVAPLDIINLRRKHEIFMRIFDNKLLRQHIWLKGHMAGQGVRTTNLVTNFGSRMHYLKFLDNEDTPREGGDIRLLALNISQLQDGEHFQLLVLQSLVVLGAKHAEIMRIFSIRQQQPVLILATNHLLQISALGQGHKYNHQAGLLDTGLKLERLEVHSLESNPCIDV